MSLFLFSFFFFHFVFLFLPRLSFRIFSLTNFSSFYFVFREFILILFKVCVPFMIILHGNENKVYGGREMERKMNLSNFMYARLYDVSKDMITNKFYFFIQSTYLTKEYFIIWNIRRNWWQAKWKTIWISFSAFFCLNYAYACYVLKLWTWYHGWSQNGKQCMFVPRGHLFTWYANEMYVYG